MISPKFLRNNQEFVSNSLKKRQLSFDLNQFQIIESQKLSLLKEIEKLQLDRNTQSKAIAKLKHEKKDTNEIQLKVKKIGEEIKKKKEKLLSLEEEVENFCLLIPNILDEDVPLGVDESENKVIKSHSAPSQKFDIKSHDEIGIKKNIFNFERASRTSGSRFTYLTGKGAILSRAIASFFLEQNSKRGYVEYNCPLIVNEKSLMGTGQLPKFKDDLFSINKENFYLIPTAEVSLINYYQDSIINEKELPIRMMSHTPCFRAEAGSAGKDTKGLIRQHQFEKVELVSLTAPETSKAEHEKMIHDIEELLKAMELPYRISLLCSGDTGFSASKCYDLEVWLPASKRYMEISSVSNCSDFQAYRGKIRAKSTQTNKNYYLHTLNGSALAVGRTLTAILENFQDANANIFVPKVLQKYTHFDKI